MFFPLFFLLLQRNILVSPSLSKSKSGFRFIALLVCTKISWISIFRQWISYACRGFRYLGRWISHIKWISWISTFRQTGHSRMRRPFLCYSPRSAISISILCTFCLKSYLGNEHTALSSIVALFHCGGRV